MRRISVVVTFVLGACAGSVGTIAVGPGANVAAAGASAVVRALSEAEVRTAPSNRARVTLLAQGDNAFLGRLWMEGGAAVPEHRDATEEYIHVLSGGGTMSIDGVEHTLEAGSTVFMPSNAKVSFTNGPDPMEAIQVFAGPAPAKKYDQWR